jgi:AraC-like DNA-binding protein
MSHVQLLFASPLITVRDHICTVGKDERTPVRGGGPTVVRLVRRGCFYCHLGTRALLADSAVACIQFEGCDYRASHPCDGGDDCTLFELAPGLLDEIFGAAAQPGAAAFHMSPEAQLGHVVAYDRLRRSWGDRLADQETALGLLRLVARQARVAEGGARQRRTVDAAKAFVNQHIDLNLELGEIAREVGCSPYHLMRMFRAETGLALRAYRTRLRVAAVMDRMAEGAEDLTQLALDFGFTSHSHLTATFRQVLGRRPSDVRDRLGRRAAGGSLSFLEGPRATAA